MWTEVKREELSQPETAYPYSCHWSSVSYFWRIKAVYLVIILVCSGGKARVNMPPSLPDFLRFFKTEYWTKLSFSGIHHWFPFRDTHLLIEKYLWSVSSSLYFSFTWFFIYIQRFYKPFKILHHCNSATCVTRKLNSRLQDLINEIII